MNKSKKVSREFCFDEEKRIAILKGPLLLLQASVVSTGPKILLLKKSVECKEVWRFFLGASESFKLFKNFYFDILFLKSLNIQGRRKKSNIREAVKGVQLL